jgi:DNA polymerase sigma
LQDCAIGGDGAASTSILLDVACILNESDEFEQVEAVTNARVPIVKFVSAKDDLKIE